MKCWIVTLRRSDNGASDEYKLTSLEALEAVRLNLLNADGWNRFTGLIHDKITLELEESKE